MTNKKPYGTVLIKAAKILDYLATVEQGAILKNIAQEVKMTASTTLKILDTLLLIGYVSRNEADKSYTLGPALAKYSSRFFDHSLLKNSASPILEHLQTKVDETIHLGILNGIELVYVDKLEPKHQSIFMSSKVGMSRPLYSTGMGKIFLSDYTEEELVKYFSEVTLETYTEKTITNKFLLIKELAKIHETQVAYDDEEMEKDCFCIAMPINGRDGMEGAFSVSMPKFRGTPENVDYVITEMKKAKEQIEEKIQQY
ncbi:IclR family transcriptional regulator [Enterococcus alcedinis]|uniref:IclR family transcriptional regulator n=1 Tax=Enterococcus alcedinis TaxID=1274384 RepID=A0A917JEE9_9ENTE|nr:IclR family transcriptional regulator [Enterococcus alcedinis]MBP2101702.1 DNA-binding IclR family transcriptional regulator [Enterococcus alcedinis]GGI65266.1 IclR family transcriptional regulator [Enterococcus alcedinis]